MTDQQKIKIKEMRIQGCGYGKIAAFLGVSDNAVKSFCRRNNLTGNMTAEAENTDHVCPVCGKSVPQNPGRKEKRFCTTACRQAWWNSHRHLVKHRTERENICPCCNKTFVSYGKTQRKYCSHQCYIRDRFGGGGDE